jgi:hypothetical protein
MKTKTAIEKISKVLEKSPYVKGDNIKGEFIIRGDSIEFIIGNETYLFDEEGDLLLKIVPRES